ncbi:MAG: hypothetical protein AMJ81_13310 [Phycisphaerae bacterium SM23_33]|nr:MAG: hypothetical protein AMJ81_13310 [Phycisphaerae bacterium SM23_33]
MELDARRRSVQGVLLLVLGLLAVPLVGLAVHRAALRYVSHSLPVPPVLFAAVIVWLGVGLPAQMRLQRDRQWNAFVRCMPVGPADLLAVHLLAGMTGRVVVAIFILCGLAGMGIELWTPASASRWLVVAAGVLWVSSMQVACTTVVSRVARAERIAVAILAVWALVLAGRTVIQLAGQHGESTVSHLLSGDPALCAVGITPLVRALLAPDDKVVRAGLLAIAHMGLVTAVCTAASWRLVLRPALVSPRRPLAVRLTRPLRGLLCRLPGPFGGEFCIEWLRTLRGTSTYVPLYAFAAVVGSILLRWHRPEDSIGAIVPLLAGVLMVGDGVPEMVKARPAGRLYAVYGVNPKHYVAGFLLSVGLCVGAICLAQLPLSLHLYEGIREPVVMAGAVIATPLVVGPYSLFVERFCGQAKGIRALWRGVKASILVLPIPFVLLGMASVFFLAPLLLAGLLVILQARRASRSEVEKFYWRLQTW